MDEQTGAAGKCLTADESREISAAWHALQQALEPIGQLVALGDSVDCDELHMAFLKLTPVFDSLERAVMLAHQIRLLQHTQSS